MLDNNQIPASSKKRLEVSADSQNSSLPDEENFQFVALKKKHIDSTISDNVSDMDVTETVTKSKKPEYPPSKLFLERTGTPTRISKRNCINGPLRIERQIFKLNF